MRYTENINLKKPSYKDCVNVSDLNDNFDVIDEKLASVATKQYVDSAIAEATENIQIPSEQPFVVGTDEPMDNTKLWIDTTEDTGGLKYYDGTAWEPVPVSYA